MVPDLDAARDSEVTGAIDRLLALQEYQRRPEARTANHPAAATGPEYRELRLAS
jgi:hypothetical protein